MLTNIEYEEGIQQIIESAREDYDGDFGFQEALDEITDNHQWTIYTHYNLQVLALTGTRDAYTDDMGEEGVCLDGSVNWAVLALYALRADVRDAVDREEN